MHLEQNLAMFGTCVSQYANRWARYEAAGFNQALDLQDKENSFATDAARQHYFAIGTDALRIIVKSLISAALQPPTSILDFPCGSGRVTRHLRAMFPEATIGACDLYPQHTRFCAETFGAQSIQSTVDLATLDVGRWDLIFCGSLLTHLPEAQFWPAIDFMLRSLNPNGIAVITLEGRRSIDIQKNRYKLIDDDLFALARKGYDCTGFGYVDYERAFLTSKFNAQDSYGLALVRPDWFIAGLTSRPSATLLSYSEGDWDDHQDVVTILKRPVGFR